jgi:hypothetical protein
MKSRTLAVLAAAVAALVAAPAAQANHMPANMGIEVTAVDPAARTVTGIQHCTSPDRAGRPATFPVTPDIEFSQFQPGMMWGIAVDPAGVIQSTNDMPCNVRPSRPGPGPGPGQPGPGQPGPHDHDEHGGPEGGPGSPQFDPRFINRVWKFNVAVDGYESGKLTVTIERVLNLPSRFRTQDDEIVDESALVLVSSSVRVYEDGKRVRKSILEDADGVAKIHGKLLRPDKWQADEDGEKVPTLRARKIYL